MDEYIFGYPKSCKKCTNISASEPKLQVAPFYRLKGQLRLMLIGQDPTIYRKPERVKHVLMLDQPNGQLSRWLKTLLGKKNYDSLTLYAVAPE